MRKNLKTPLIVIIIIAFILLVFIPTPYMLTKPGSAENLQRFVEVQDIDYENEGIFYLVTIAQQRATVPWLIYGFFNPYIDIIHYEQVIPPGLDIEDYRRILERWMEESQLLSKIIALNRAGYEDDYKIEGEGIEIRGFVGYSPAEETLQENDVILEVDGEEVYFADQVIALVQDRQVGDPVALKIKRNKDTFNVKVTTTSHADDDEKPAMGVYISALGDLELTLPFDIDIKTGNISGPSAGVMFVLEIINQLMPGDLAGGRRVAGTGTINYFEDVGTIGGVKQKVVAAEREGADFFIVPEGNYDEAAKAANNIEIVSVNNMQDVIDFLNRINVTSSYESWFSLVIDYIETNKIVVNF